MIRAVIFDLDGTLHDRQASVEALARDQYARFPELHGVPPDLYLTRFMELDARGYVPKPRVFGPLCEELSLPLSLGQRLEEDYFERYGTFSIGFPGMDEVLGELLTADYALGLITNGRERLQRTKIESLGIADRFFSILISETAGFSKPDPRIYLQCLVELGVTPREAVMVGDNPELDVAGPQAVGIRAIWFRDPYWGESSGADAECASLAELPGLIKQLER